MLDFREKIKFRDFLKNVFEKILDFLELQTHNNRAFKLALCEKEKSTPEISRINRNIVNKSSSSKWFLMHYNANQKSVQEEICRQLNLEYPNFD